MAARLRGVGGGGLAARHNVRVCAGECVSVCDCVSVRPDRVKIKGMPSARLRALGIIFFQFPTGTVLVSGAGLGMLPSVHYMTLGNYIVCRVSYS